MVELIDAHAHLEDVKDLRGAIKRAAEVSVVAIVAVGSDYNSNMWVMYESQKYEIEGLKIYPALGLHPWSLNNTRIEETIDFIEENIDRITALGEVGLDYCYKDVRRDENKREEQKRIFWRILDIARKGDKPILVHSRGAWMDCVNMVIEAGVKRAIFHWFSGSIEVLKKLLDHGYYISATPAAAYSKEHRRAVNETPLENIVLETDSPVIYAGEEAEPAHVIRALRAVAELKDKDANLVAEKTTENARRIFRID